MKAVIKKISKFFEERDIKREQFRKDAGIILAHEAHAKKNRKAKMSQSKVTTSEIIRITGVASDCCGSMCVRNYAGQTICVKCLAECKETEVANV